MNLFVWLHFVVALVALVASCSAFESLANFLPNGNNYRRRVALRYKYAEQVINDFTENQTLTNVYKSPITRWITNPTFVTRFRLFKKVHFLTANIADYVSSGLYFRITTALFSGCKFYLNEEYGMQGNAMLTYFRIAFVKDVELKKFVYLHTFNTFDLFGVHQDELSFLKCKLRPNFESNCKSSGRFNETVWDDFKKWFRSNSIVNFVKSYDVMIKKVHQRISFFSNFVHIIYDPLPKCNSLSANHRKSNEVIFAPNDNHLKPTTVQQNFVTNSTIKLLREHFLETRIAFVSNCPVHSKGLKEMMKEFRSWKYQLQPSNFSQEQQIRNVTEIDDQPKYSNLVCALNRTDFLLLLRLWEIQKFIENSFKIHLENVIRRMNFNLYVLRENYFTLGNNSILNYARISIMNDNNTYHIASTFYCLRVKNISIRTTNVANCTIDETLCTFDNFHLPSIYDQNIKNYLRFKSLRSFTPVV